ncbi:MAG TPA: SDR family oxidoreductase [Candidatus Polarisedimenticolaceae bacterium]|nr:SDR family oxidoreductase [Candidatus Polarisedimenticolaceae bacterium]
MSKVALVTGASSGIGRATAELMARRGWQVAATSRNVLALSPWAAERGIEALELDVAVPASAAAAVAAAMTRFGRIDVLVNNAGYGVFGPLEGATREEIELQFRTNVMGPIEMIRQVLPAMRERRDGAIVNVSSIGGRTAAPFASLYHASKFAIEGLSESLRYELSLHGIRLKLIEPAHFKTGFISRSLRTTTHASYDGPFRNYMGWVRREDRKAPGPGPVAEAILRAAEDRSARLRYPVRGALVLAMTRFLPDGFFRPLLAGGMTRKPPDPEP